MTAKWSRRRLLATTGALAATGAAGAAGATVSGRPDGAADGASALDPPPLQWQQTYGETLSDGATAVTQTDTGRYVLAGTTLVQDGGQTETPWFVALDDAGDVVWTTIPDLPGTPVVRDIVPAPEGGVFAVGERRALNEPRQALVARLDESGLQWSQTLSSPLSESGGFTGVRVGSDLVVGGGTRDADRTSGYLARIGPSGSTRWTTGVDTGALAVVYSLVRTDDGLAGCGVSRGATELETNLLAGWVLGVSPDGTVQWQDSHLPQTEDTAHRRTFARDLVATDEGYLVVGSSAPPGAEQPFPWVMGVDAEGGLVTQTAYQPSGLVSGQLTGVEPAGGEYLAVGTTQSGDDVAGFWFQGFDAGTVQQWARRAVVQDNSRASGVTRGADGGLVVVGTATRTDSGNQDAAAVKLGPDRTPTPTPTETPTPSPTVTATPTATQTPTAESAADTPMGGTATTDGSGPGVGVLGALAGVAGGVRVALGRAGRDGPAEDE
jgi:hypothetical protein